MREERRNRFFSPSSLLPPPPPLLPPPSQSLIPPNFLRGWLMPPQKTRPQREKELPALPATPTGREELQRLESRCLAASGRLRPASTSVITYILVHEREQGLVRS